MSVFNFLAALIALYLLWALLIRFGLKRLTCARSFSRRAVFEGEQAELIETVRNDGPFVIPWLRLETKISPYLRLGRQENLDVREQMYYCSLFTLMPYQQIRRFHRVEFLHRGAYDLGNAALTAGDVLGIFQFLRGQNLSTPILVYPAIMEQEELPLSVSQVLGELVRRRQLQEDPFLVRGIRSYQPGDPVRDIHWAATARTGQAQVTIHDYSARTKLLVVLNVQYLDIQLNNYIPDHHSGPIEDGIRLAASACVHALRMGLPAGFAANMPLGEERGGTVILPADGSAQEEELLAAFARLNLWCAEKFPIFLDSLAEYEGLDILVLSRYDSDSIRESMTRLERAGNRVHFHLLEGGAT